MKPVFRYWIIATLAIWILTLVTCKNSIEDDLISRSSQVLDETDSDWTTITASGRDLLLEGESLNETESESLASEIKNVNGVRVVDNKFTILDPLVERANSALKSEQLTWVNVDGDNETLILSGEALIQTDIDSATASVSKLRGLTQLTNNIKLLLPLPERARTLLDMNGKNWVQIEGNDTDLILTGEALSQGDIEATLNHVSGLRGLKVLENKLSLLAPLKERAKSTLDASGFNWVNVEGEHNHLILTGDAANKESVNGALASLNSLRGLERLTNNISLLAPLSQRAQTLLDDQKIKWASMKISDSDVTLTGSTIDETIADQLVAKMKGLAGVGQVNNNINVLSKLNVDDCQSNINQLLAGEKIEFETGSATINSKSLLLLSKLANTSRQCPQATIVVMGHTDNTGNEDSNVELSQKRAHAVVDNLVAKGVSSSRLTANGLGPWYPIESNDTEEGRRKNRRIEFKVN